MRVQKKRVRRGPYFRVLVTRYDETGAKHKGFTIELDPGEDVFTAEAVADFLKIAIEANAASVLTANGV